MKTKMKTLKKYVIGKVYIGSTEPFETVRVVAYNSFEALNLAANYLQPHHLQTLTIITVKTLEEKSS